MALSVRIGEMLTEDLCLPWNINQSKQPWSKLKLTALILTTFFYYRSCSSEEQLWGGCLNCNTSIFILASLLLTASDKQIKGITSISWWICYKRLSFEWNGLCKKRKILFERHDALLNQEEICSLWWALFWKPTGRMNRPISSFVSLTGAGARELLFSPNVTLS